jgi:chaperonin cofactor prefoldin
MLDGVRRHQSLIKTPAPPDIGHFDDEMASPKMTLKRRLEIYGCIVARTVETLADLEKAVEQQIKAASDAEESLRSQTKSVQEYIDNKLKQLRQKQAEYQDCMERKEQVDAAIVEVARKHMQV